jgi:Zn-dependent protease
VLFQYGDLIQTSTWAFITIAGSALVALLLGVAFHEFNHAFTADALGDPTPRYMGRVSLNPIVHLDPVGSLMMLLIGFGWGKPVQFNPNNLRDPVTGSALISFAGPLANLVVAGLAAIPLRLDLVPRQIADLPFTPTSWGPENYLGLFLSSLVILNIVLAVFNLIPLPPLDGFKVVLGILPRDLAREYARIEPYGPGILMILILLPFLTNGQISILGDIIGPVVSRIVELLVGEPL